MYVIWFTKVYWSFLVPSLLSFRSILSTFLVDIVFLTSSIRVFLDLPCFRFFRSRTVWKAFLPCTPDKVFLPYVACHSVFPVSALSSCCCLCGILRPISANNSATSLFFPFYIHTCLLRMRVLKLFLKQSFTYLLVIYLVSWDAFYLERSV